MDVKRWGAAGAGRRRVRPAAVAGMFYPDDPHQLVAVVDGVLAEALDRRPAAGSPANARPPKALIAPHAGYVYSGPIAASAYARVAPLRGVVERVVLLGPAHRVPVDGLAVPAADAFDTPLGPVTVDAAAREVALTVPGVHADDVPHGPEHSLEVHLPFLLRVLGPDIRVLPVVVGRARATMVADLLDRLWGGDETLIVVSSDLSHYLDHGTATARDTRTAAAIVARQGDAITPEDACGAYPIRGLLEAARRHGLAVEQLDLRTSGDTAGDRARVVGYGAFALREPA